MDAKLNLYSNGKWVPYNVETTAKQVKYTAPDNSTVTMQEYIDGRVKSIVVEPNYMAFCRFRASQTPFAITLTGAVSAPNSYNPIMLIIPVDLTKVTSTSQWIAASYAVIPSTGLSASIFRDTADGNYEILIGNFSPYYSTGITLSMPEGATIISLTQAAAAG